MKDFGAMIRSAREAKGWSREDLAEKTRINLHHIVALEEGLRDALPVEIYVRAQLKAIAEALGMDYAALGEAFDRARSGGKAPKHDQQRPTKETRPLFRHPAGESFWLRHQRHIVFGAILLVFVAFFVGLNLLNKTTTPEGDQLPPAEDAASTRFTPDQVHVDTVAAAAGKPSRMNAWDRRQEIRVDPGKMDPRICLARSDSLSLEIQAAQDNSILVETDFRRVFKGWLPRGTRRIWNARDAFFISADHAWALDLYVNGFHLRMLPRTEESVELNINRDNILAYLDPAEWDGPAASPAGDSLRSAPADSSPGGTPKPRKPRGVVVPADPATGLFEGGHP